MPANRPASVFFCYAPQDEELRRELEKHLDLLRRRGDVKSWSARSVGAGEEWRGEVHRQLRAADIILLLVSADFLASDYLYDVEMRTALTRLRDGEAEVVAVLLRPIDLPSLIESAFQLDGERVGVEVVPANGKAVTSFADREVAFAEITRHIRKRSRRRAGGYR